MARHVSERTKAAQLLTATRGSYRNSSGVKRIYALNELGRHISNEEEKAPPKKDYSGQWGTYKSLLIKILGPYQQVGHNPPLDYDYSKWPDLVQQAKESLNAKAAMLNKVNVIADLVRIYNSLISIQDAVADEIITEKEGVDRILEKVVPKLQEHLILIGDVEAPANQIPEPKIETPELKKTKESFKDLREAFAKVKDEVESRVNALYGEKEEAPKEVLLQSQSERAHMQRITQQLKLRDEVVEFFDANPDKALLMQLPVLVIMKQFNINMWRAANLTYAKLSPGLVIENQWFCIFHGYGSLSEEDQFKRTLKALHKEAPDQYIDVLDHINAASVRTVRQPYMTIRWPKCPFKLPSEKGKIMTLKAHWMMPKSSFDLISPFIVSNYSWPWEQ